MEQSPVISTLGHLFSCCAHCESRLRFSNITTKNLPCEKPAQTVITGTPTSKSLRRSILSHSLTSPSNDHPFRATVDTQNDISHQQNANTHAAFNVRDTFHSDQCDRERPVRGNCELHMYGRHVALMLKARMKRPCMGRLLGSASILPPGDFVASTFERLFPGDLEFSVRGGVSPAAQ